MLILDFNVHFLFIFKVTQILKIYLVNRAPSINLFAQNPRNMFTKYINNNAKNIETARELIFGDRFIF